MAFQYSNTLQLPVDHCSSVISLSTADSANWYTKSSMLLFTPPDSIYFHLYCLLCLADRAYLNHTTWLKAIFTAAYMHVRVAILPDPRCVTWLFGQFAS
jgi:hypothetical protein